MTITAEQLDEWRAMTHLQLIPAARTAIPALIDEVERLREALGDAMAFIAGDISGESQRQGILSAARAALPEETGEKKI